MSTPTSNSISASNVSLTGNNSIDSLIMGSKWGGVAGTSVALTYSFPDLYSYWSTVAYGSSLGSGEPWDYYYGGLSASYQIAAQSAMSKWSDVANISFTQVADNVSTVGDIRFAWTNGGGISGAQAQAYFPSSSVLGGDVWLNYLVSWDGTSQGSYTYNTFLHEIGHALGLKHTFQPFGSSNTVLPSSEDGYPYSIMSYSAYPGVSGSRVDFNPTTPMSYDIAAIQYLYGANMSYHSGDDTYTFTQGQSYFQTIWDAGGTDTIVWNASTESGVIDLRAGSWSDLGNALTYHNANGSYLMSVNDNVAIYKNVIIENATGGAASDLIIGNDVANRLNGGLGNDAMYGNAGNDVFDWDVLLRGGNDTMYGGTGDDSFVLDSTGDVVIELVGEGLDVVFANFSYNLSSAANVEDLVLFGTDNVNGTGSSGNNTILGNSGNNSLIGGGGGGDTFLFNPSGNGIDTILDASIGDKLTIVGASFNNYFVFGDGLTVGLNEIQCYTSAGITTICIGTDSFIGADILVQLNGVNISQLFSQGASVYIVNAQPTGTVTISGTATQNQTLTAGNTLADIDGLGTISYQWQADGSNIVGATNGTLVLAQAQVGKAITVTASYTDGQGAAESVASSATAAVVNVNDAPTGSVTITGTATQGQMLTASNSIADIDGLGAITYQWKAAGVNISDATNSTLVLAEAQVGKAITVTASYTDGQGAAESVASSATAAVVNVNDAPTGSVTITGTATQGQMLTASNSIADIDGLGAITYQWKAAGVNISDATNSTLVLAEAQVGKAITVTASYTDGHGTAESVASAAVVMLPANIINKTAAGNVLSNTNTLGDATHTGTSNDLITILAPTSLAATNTINGQSGTDEIRFTSITAGQTLTLGAGITNVEKLTIGTGTTDTATTTATTALNVNAAVVLTGMTITGNDGNNIITGTQGADTINSGAGNDTIVANNGDTMNGQTGNDTLIFTRMADGNAFSFNGGSNVDEIRLSNTGTLTHLFKIASAPATGVTATASQIEAVTLGTGTAIAAITTATTANGIDASAYSENGLTLTGNAGINTIIGTGFDDTLNGGAGNDTLVGGFGNDSLDGGAGNDSMDGGHGDDTYVVDVIGDIIATDSSGTDLVKSSITYSLATRADLESLTLTGITAINGTGNSATNILTGNAAANTLNGGAGADTMNGGKGADTYIVDDLGDTVTEDFTLALLGGVDLVKSSVTFTLGINVDNLTLGTVTSTEVIDGTGNDINNIIIGNAGNNYLTGNAGIDTLTGNDGNDTLDGGLGNDTMNGGKGDDLYIVDSITDVVTESFTNLLGGGIDTIQSSVTRTLGANFDNLTLTGSVAINGTGNSLGNVIFGNDGNNVIQGLGGNDTINGGTGNDTLVGGLGNDSNLGGDGSDIFRFESTLNAVSNLDTITDFTSGDVLQLENSIFMKLTITGALSGNNFRSAAGVTAQDTNDYILYDTANGALYYDADGNGAGAAIHFATLVGLPSIVASDIWIT